ncbi:unnamed protein product, partial [Didymodactylos carnosus]
MTNTSTIVDRTTLFKIVEQYLTFSDDTSVIEFISWIKRRLKLTDISSVKESGVSLMNNTVNNSDLINTSQLFMCRCGHRYSLRFTMTDFLNGNNKNPSSSPYCNSSEQDCIDIDTNMISDDDDGNLTMMNGQQNIINEPLSPNNNGSRANRRKLSKPVRKDLTVVQQQQIDTTNKDIISTSSPHRSVTSRGSRESDYINEPSPNEVTLKLQRPNEDKSQKNTTTTVQDVPIIHSEQRHHSTASYTNRSMSLNHKSDHHSTSSFRHRCPRCGVAFSQRSSLARHRLRPCGSHHASSSNVKTQNQLYSNKSYSSSNHRPHHSQQLSKLFICSYCSIRLHSREQISNHESMHQQGYYYCKKCFEFYIPVFDNGQSRSHDCCTNRTIAERTLLNAFTIDDETTTTLTDNMTEKNNTTNDQEQVNDFTDNDVDIKQETTSVKRDEYDKMMFLTQKKSIHQKQHIYNE